MSRKPSSPAVPSGTRRWHAPAVCLALAAITLAVFWRTTGFKFVNFDDNYYVYDNPVVARGLTLKGIVWAFTGAHASNWHPLTWLSHMLDCQLYGLHPGGHHLTNVLLHIATVIALFLVLRQMTGAFWRSAFVAAVFAIHPLRVESVAWVTERKDVLSGLFFMLTIGAYVRYARLPRSWARSGLVAFLFAMGLMCKPMLVTVPLVLLLLDYWPLQRKESAGRLVMEKLPLLAFSAVSCVVTLVAQRRDIHADGPFSLPVRVANASVTCVVYLRQMIWPSGLAAFYPFPHNGVPTRELALAGTLLTGFSAVAVWQRRKQPWLLTGWAWYLVMLLPVVGIIQAGRQAHADRYTYLPQIGIYVAAAWWVAQWRVNRVVLGSLMAGVLAALMVCACKQTLYWQDSEHLWAHALTCTRENYIAHYNLGTALILDGRPDEAVNHFQEALQIKPDYDEALNNLGSVLFHQGRTDEAILQFQKALQFKPRNAAAYINLGNAFLRKGNLDEAGAHYQKALQINPGYTNLCSNLAADLQQKGKTDEAIVLYESLLQINPGNAGAHYNLGTALAQKGRVDEAITHLQKALQINPDNVPAHDDLGNALLQKGNTADALAHFQTALQIAPADPSAQNNLAWLLATCSEASLRNGGQAVQLARKASELTGGANPSILDTLAAALAEAGRFSEAVETAQRALDLARAQSNVPLEAEVQSELKLYKAGKPFHSPARTH